MNALEIRKNEMTLAAANLLVGYTYEGAKAGRFVVLAHRTVGFDAGVQVRPVGGRGEMFFTPDMLKAETKAAA